MLKKFKATKLQNKITLVITILLILSLLIFSIWFYFFRSAPKILSIINLNTFPIYLKIDNEKVALNIFDTYNKNIHYRNNITIQVYKQNDTLAKEIIISDLIANSEIIEVVLSEKNDYCYFSANVTDFYRFNAGEINNIDILTNEPSDKFIAEITPNSAIYVYPGKILNKEETHDASKSILTVLPIECNKVDDQSVIVNTVKVFKDFDSKKQREFYENKLKEIEGTQDIELLKSFIKN